MWSVSGTLFVEISTNADMRAFIALLFFVSVVWAESTDHFKSIFRPEAEICKQQLNASDDDADAIVNLDKDLFSPKAKILAACVFERLGVMKDGWWYTVPPENRLKEYKRYFEGDAKRLEAADSIINICHAEADEKNKGKQGAGGDVAYDGIACFWRFTN